MMVSWRLPVLTDHILGTLKSYPNPSLSFRSVFNRTLFFQRFVENANVGACHNELLMLEHGEVQSMFKLRATTCLFSAIENSHDAVEITSLDPERAEFQVEVQKQFLSIL